MKKILLTMAVVFFLLSCPAFAGEITGLPTITAAVSAGGSYSGTSSSGGSYNIQGIDGYVGVQVSVAGSGTLSMTYLLSNDRVTFSEPESQKASDDILSGITSASGTVFKSFTPVMGRYMKFEIAETGGASAYTATIIPSIK